MKRSTIALLFVVSALAALAALVAALSWRSEPRDSKHETEVETDARRDPVTPQDHPSVPDDIARTGAGGSSGGPGRTVAGTERGEVEIVGRVVDARGAALAGARVIAAPASRGADVPLSDERFAWSGRVSTSSDANGRFALRVAIGTPLRVLARAKGCAPLERTWTASATTRDLGELVLVDSARLRGRVVDAARRPVGGARIERLPPDAPPALILGGGELAATSAADGTFEIDELARGTWLLAVRSDAHPLALARGETKSAGERVEGLEIALEDGFEIHGRVVGASVEVLRALAIDATPRNLQRDGRTFAGEHVDEQRFLVLPRRAPCTEDGSFTLRGLTANVPYRVGGFAPLTNGATVAAAPRTNVVEALAGGEELTLTYVAPTGIELLVVDATSGAPIEELEVQSGVNVLQPLASDDGEPLTTFPGGRVRIERGLELRDDERLTILVSARGYETQRLDGIAPKKSASTDLGVLRLARAPSVGVLVLEGDSDRPVANADVRIVSDGATVNDAEAPLLRATTGTDGRARLNIPSTGAPRLRVSHAEFAPSETALDLATAREGSQTVRLVRGGSARIEVRDDAGRGVSGARIVHRAPASVRQTMPRTDPLRADDRGTLVLEHLAIGTHTFEVELPRARTDADASSSASIDVRDGEELTVSLVVGARARLSGRVTEAGRPLSGATLKLVSQTGPGGAVAVLSDTPSARTNGAGEFAFASIEPGVWTLRVEHSARALAHVAEIQVTAPETRVEIALPNASIEGVVLGADGRPLAGAEVRVAREKDGSASATVGAAVRSAASGRFTLRGLPPDVPLVLLASAERHADLRSAPLTLARDEARGGIELKLTAACDLDVHVVAAGAIGARGCQVVARRAESDATTNSIRVTDAEGNVKFRGLDGGRWGVRVEGCGVEPARSAETEVWVELVAGELASVTITLP